jgi:hypothetical protein
MTAVVGCYAKTLLHKTIRFVSVSVGTFRLFGRFGLFAFIVSLAFHGFIVDARQLLPVVGLRYMRIEASSFAFHFSVSEKASRDSTGAP